MKCRIWLFGVFNPHDKKFYYRVSQKCNSEQMVLFLRQIRQRYPNKNIHLVLDNASFHHSAETAYFLHHNEEFITHFLPAKSPRLNPIERFWLFVKENTIAGGFFQNLNQIYHVLRRFFWRYSNGDITFNFQLHKLIDIWKFWPTVDPP